MVNYKTRIFFEPETNSLGADVIIYSEEGDKIDTILITSESKYNELHQQIQEIDNKFIDVNELTTILVNVQNELEINATKFAGMDINSFSLVGHTHEDLPPKNHASVNQEYGVASTSEFGHAKLINNLAVSQYNSGEALSAYQGNVLKNLIDTVKSDLMKWEQITLSGHNSIANYCRLYVNKALRLARFTYNRTGVVKGVASTKTNGKNDNPSPYTINGKATTNGIYLHTAGAIPESYSPTIYVATPSYRGDFVLRLISDGSILVHNLNGKSVNGGFEIHANLLYHY